jgi:hypothetical protein
LERVSDPIEPSASIPDDSVAAADPAMDQLRQAAEGQIDNFLRSVGVATPSVDDQGVRHIVLGSANGTIGFARVDDVAYLYVIASVMDLPSDRELILPLMRDLLELNVDVKGPARGGIRGNAVLVSAMLPAAGLRDEDVGFAINNAMSLADRMAEPLLQRYGGTSKVRG